MQLPFKGSGRYSIGGFVLILACAVGFVLFLSLLVVAVRLVTG